MRKTIKTLIWCGLARVLWLFAFMGSDLEAAEGLHEELGLAGVLRQEADGGPHVDTAHRDLEDCAALLGDPAVLARRLFVRRC